MRSYPLTACCTAVVVLTAVAGTARAYPEFQKSISQASGRPLNCAMCHLHSDGPEGTAPGQIGHLTDAEQAEFGRARAAFEPNANIKSPILNRFGNHIINSLGKKQFLELKAMEPKVMISELANRLPKDSDLDGDGITDVQELLAGTHPLIKSDGRPWLLFKANLSANLGQILLMLAATILGLRGLRHLLHGFDIAAHWEDGDDEDADEHTI